MFTRSTYSYTVPFISSCYLLSYFISKDNDECATNNGGCEVHCTNTLGSFECSCDDHEILDATGLFCVGT